jgi:hypothetical protein
LSLQPCWRKILNLVIDLSPSPYIVYFNLFLLKHRDNYLCSTSQ